MKKLLLSVGVLALSASLALADVVLGTGAVSQSNAGNQFSMIGGAGSIGNGIAISGSQVSNRNASSGLAAGATIGLASGATTSTLTTGNNNSTNFGASAGQAGGFSGSATSGGGVSNAFAFGGLGFTSP